MGLGVPCDGGNGDEGEGGCAAGGATVRLEVERNESTCCVRDKASQANKLSYKAARELAKLEWLKSTIIKHQGGDQTNRATGGVLAW